ncbi:non-ribosomal peptide synthetase, partial [Puia sp.]|uniref:non-ribosomal peptide synthetase n=1 Tax=Puia sp. TaxID=2045100 RepID=UPI002F408963
EEVQLREGFNATAVDYPGGTTIPDLLSAALEQTPEAIAVVAGDGQLTYRQLHERANRLGQYLRGKGIRTGDRVAIRLDRGTEMIIAILGVLKAGAAYVPIDPLYPPERIAYLLQDSAPAAVITAAWLQEHRQGIDRQSDDDPRHGLRPEHAAYIIYTSGSTGKPKGVVNEHRGVVNRLRWTQDFFRLGPQDAVLQKTTFCFDVSVWELLWPLFTGARLVFARPDGQLDIPYLKTLIDTHRITTLHFVPSMLTPFLEQTRQGECAGLQRVLCSGEALLPHHLRLFQQKLPAAALYNLYGPTEAAIDVSCWAVPAGWKGDSVPIGLPVANTQLYVLDDALNLLPIGVTGELYIGGVQVAREYWRQPALTAERFIADPFSPVAGARLYRTGDLARRLPDGNLEYLGRKDDQVKIRGYRIELGEIEQAALQSGLVSQAAVVAGTDKGGGNRLIGYIVPAAGSTLEALRTCLAGQLPEFMLPSLWVVLEALPLTASGKLDKKALPAPEGNIFQPAAYVAPRTETEALLAGIWKELLNASQVGIHDNFFTLGGHSLLGMRLVSAISKKMNVELPVKMVFQLTTISLMAKFITVIQCNSLVEEEAGETIKL